MNHENKFKVIIAGSRGFTDYKYVKSKLDYMLQNIQDEIIIISGRCSTGSKTFVTSDGIEVFGADGLGELYAADNNYKVTPFPADWDDTYDKPRTEISFRNNRPYWTKAGLYRNGLMADEADALICFVVNNSKGSLNMIKQAKEKNLKVKVYNIEK